MLFRLAPKRLHKYLRLGRFDKPTGTYLVMLPFMMGSGLGMESLEQVATMAQHCGMFAVGAYTLRAGGCVVNDFWDRDIDKHVARTIDRPLASREVSLPGAFAFLLTNFSLGMGSIACLGPAALKASALSIPLTILYPLMKRCTNYPQYFLGMTINQGLFIGYAAMAGGSPLVLLPVYFALASWTVIYDTIYAHQDKSFDSRLGLGSTALLWGQSTLPTLQGHLRFFFVSMLSAAYFLPIHIPSFLPLFSLFSLAFSLSLNKVNIASPENCARFFRNSARMGFLLYTIILLSKCLHLEQKENEKEKPEGTTE